ncbi:MAG TPA: asparaginase, partial [bacterium]|nr:asparaginase [bacterium]
MTDSAWPFAPWLRIERGGRAEAILQGALVVRDDRGQVRARWGDPGWPSYLRSGVKMIQAVPLVASGAADRWDLEPRHLAVCCASHSGETAHLTAVREILERCGADESMLHCGAHAPFHAGSAEELVRGGERPRPIHHDCSGKHAGMMATCAHRGQDVAGYWRRDHPLQQEIHDVLAALADVDGMPWAVDGCGVPTWHLPLDAFALALARFVGGAGPAAEYAGAADRLVRAMQSHPEMVGGTGRFCTALPRAANRPLIAKAGAEGLYAVAWREEDGRGVALCAKAAAGDARSRDFAVTEAAAQLGLLDEAGLEALAEFHGAPLRNWAGEVVGNRVGLLRLSPQEG